MVPFCPGGIDGIGTGKELISKKARKNPGSHSPNVEEYKANHFFFRPVRLPGLVGNSFAALSSVKTNRTG